MGARLDQVGPLCDEGVLAAGHCGKVIMSGQGASLGADSGFQVSY
jgi:hypothetical protein